MHNKCVELSLLYAIVYRCVVLLYGYQHIKLKKKKICVDTQI